MDKEAAAKKIKEILDDVDSGSLKEYQDACKMTAKKFDTPKEEILTWGLGITGEAGDVASCIKKTFAHDNDQREGIKEKILDNNLEKLKARYPQGFTIEDARREGTRIDWSKKDG